MEKYNPILEKYQLIDSSGREALRNGTITSFPGFTPDLDSRFTAALLFDPQSTTGISGFLSILQGIRIACLSNVITPLVAYRDFPVHSTVMEGLYEGNGQAERLDKFQAVKERKDFQQIRESLIGLNIVYDRLLLDKANVLLAASDIPAFVFRARFELRDIYESEGLKPLKISDLLHITASRIKSIPKNYPASLQNYSYKMDELAKKVSQNPPTLIVSSVSQESAYSFLTNYPPQIV